MEGKPVGFMVDTGAQHSVLNKKLGPMSKKTSWVQGAMGTKSSGGLLNLDPPPTGVQELPYLV